MAEFGIVDNTPELPKPSEVSVLELLVVEESKGRARNARGWFVTVLVALVIACYATVATVGWSRATHVADQRGTAVEQLTRNALRQDAVDTCQDNAFATWLDDALAADGISQGVLLRYYHTCQATDGDHFR